MEALGDSVLAVGDADLLRVHVHTLRPGQALEFAVDHGTLAKVKVENMQLQHEAFAAAGDADAGRRPDGQPALVDRRDRRRRRRGLRERLPQPGRDAWCRVARR